MSYHDDIMIGYASVPCNCEGNCWHPSRKSSLLLLASIFLSIQIIKNKFRMIQKFLVKCRVPLVFDMSVSSLTRR